MECCPAPADFATDEQRRKQQQTTRKQNSGACRLKRQRKTKHENNECNANETVLPRDLGDGNDGSASDGAGLYNPA
jgi:hypothetical protein